MNVQWRGVFPAVTTQFHSDESLDIPATLRHVDALIENGVHGLIMLGTVGENCSLEYDEKLDVLRAVVEHVSGRVPVLSGVATFSCTYVEGSLSLQRERLARIIHVGRTKVAHVLAGTAQTHQLDPCALLTGYPTRRDRSSGIGSVCSFRPTSL